MTLNTLKQSNSSVISQYLRIGVQTSVESASPHRLIQILLDGALSRISIAGGHMKREEIPEKGAQISWAISIIDGLRGSLNKEAGGEVAENLDRLYEYMSRRLLEANLRNDAGALEEVHGLLSEIRSAWMDIESIAE
jgi:flagellar protein FliS